MTKKNAAGTVSFILVAILLSKVLGQAREMVIAALYGISIQTSAYVIASQLPVNFFDMILGSAISSAFIPVYNMYIEKDGEKRANLFATRFLNAVVIITVLLSLLGVIFAPNIINIFAPSMKDEVAKAIASDLLKLMFPMIIFTGLAFTLVGLLQSLGEFKIPAIMSLISNTVCIIYLFTLNNRFGIYGLAVALTLGWVLQFLILVPPSLKTGYRYSISAGIKDEGIKRVVMLALPVLFASWVQPINTTVNLSIASGMDNGSGVAALNYANRLYIMAAGVFAVSITNYIFPHLSRLSVAGDNAGWSDVISKSIKIVIMLVLPVALMFLIQGKEIIRIIYQRGEFNESAVILTSSAMLYYSIGMIWYSLQEIFNKAFYSVQDTKTPTFAAVGGIITNIIFSFTLSKFMGIAGLALAVSLSAAIWCIFSYIKIKSKLETGNFENMQFFKIIIMGAVTAAVIFFARGIMMKIVGSQSFINAFITLAVPTFAGCLIYVALAFIFGIDELKEITGKLRKGEKSNV